MVVLVVWLSRVPLREPRGLIVSSISPASCGSISFCFPVHCTQFSCAGLWFRTSQSHTSHRLSWSLCAGTPRQNKTSQKLSISVLSVFGTWTPAKDTNPTSVISADSFVLQKHTAIVVLRSTASVQRTPRSILWILPPFAVSHLEIRVWIHCSLKSTKWAQRTQD